MFADKLSKALALPKGGSEVVIPQGMIGQLGSRTRNYLDTVDGNTWFGPGQPMRPNGPESLLPRTWDYPYSSNLNTRPRSEQPDGPSFDQLRSMARVCEIVRLCIETRKDQISKMPWTFRVTQDPGETYKASKNRSKSDKRVNQLIEFFKNPDKSPEHSFQSWIRLLLEEVFVTDALSILPRKNIFGDVLMLEIIDGATIKKLIDPEGRVPAPPNAAYQQILKGIAAKNLTTDDLIYRPRNPIVNRFYGYSPTEQIMITMNVMVRRVVSQLAYYTDGNVPEMIISVPDDWSADQIKRFQDFFDAIAGNPEVQRRVRFIPGGKTAIQTKSDGLITSETDEWFTRMVCYAFSLPPTPFVKMMNRATSGNLQQSALEEGLLPLQLWIADTINYIVKSAMKIEGVEFAWADQEEADPLKQAQIDKIYVSYGKQSIDEQRERDGEDPIGVGPFVLTATGPIFLDETITPAMQRTIDNQEQSRQDGIDSQEAALSVVPPTKNGKGSPADKVAKSKKKY